MLFEFEGTSLIMPDKSSRLAFDKSFDITNFVVKLREQEYLVQNA